jgi:hypothetical protein
MARGSRWESNQYDKIVGIAWTDTPEASRISIVNMAIGLNGNEITELVVEQQNRIESLEQEFEIFKERIFALESGLETIPGQPKDTILAIDRIEDSYLATELPSSIDVDEVENAILLLSETYKANGVDINTHPGLKKLFNDQVFREEIIRKVKVNYENGRNIILNEHRR